MYFSDLLDEAKEESYEEGREQGREQGREEGLFEAVDKMVAEGIFSEEEACEVLGVDLDRYREHVSASKQ